MSKLPTSIETIGGHVWPAASVHEVQSRLTAPGAAFEMEAVSINGVPTRVWKHAFPSLAALLNESRNHGGRIFTVFEQERVSYEGFYLAVTTLFRHLQDQGVQKGDRVAIAMRNLPEWPIAFFAIACLGAIAVPLNAWWTGPELAYGLADSGTRILICDGDQFKKIKPLLSTLPTLEQCIVSRADDKIDSGATALESVLGHSSAWNRLPELEFSPVEMAMDEPATIFYTSGTTGKPKGAVGSQRNILTNVVSRYYANAFTALRQGEDPPPVKPSVILLVIPMFHVTGCHATLMPAIASGSTVVLMRKWDASVALELIERERIESTGGVPTIAWQLAEHPDRGKYDLSSLKSLSYGGAPGSPELVRLISTNLGIAPRYGYGMTELAATVTNHGGKDYENHPTSCGLAVAVCDLAVRSPDGSLDLPVGEVGELWVRGPQAALGYWQNPTATASTFVEGWVKTGDLVRLDEEGFCYIVDRAKDIIIRGGENIYSSEIENILYEHPAISDAAIVGIPHRTLGEQPAAVVQITAGASITESELQRWLAERVAGFKVPVKIIFVETPLPRNAGGKIIKKDLRAFFAKEGNESGG
jgi:acyl-CoA synthetase (AMP-forming)/AMP-acid ligase II